MYFLNYIKNIYISTAGTQEYAFEIIKIIRKEFPFGKILKQYVSGFKNLRKENNILITQKKLIYLEDFANKDFLNSSIIFDDTIKAWKYFEDRSILLHSMKFISCNEREWGNIKCHTYTGLLYERENKVDEHPLYNILQNPHFDYSNFYHTNKLPPQALNELDKDYQIEGWKDTIEFLIKAMQNDNCKTADLLKLKRKMTLNGCFISVDFISNISLESYIYDIIAYYGGFVESYTNHLLTHILYEPDTKHNVLEEVKKHRLFGREVYAVHINWLIKSVMSLKKMNEEEFLYE